MSMEQKKRLTNFIQITVLALLAIISLSPLLLVILNSFKSHSEILRNTLALPTTLTWNNYTKTWELGKLGEGFINSIKLTGTAILVGCFASATIGYVLAGRKIKTCKLITVYFMMATTIPLQLFLLPLYTFFVKMGLMGNVYAVGAVIAAWNLPLPIFLMRTYFLKVPYELEEAARIDGASTFKVFTKIMVPIVSPGLITVSVIVGLFSWNEYLLSSTLLQGEKNFTATLRFLNLNGTFSRDLSVIMAGAVIMIIPMVVLFILLQKKFIEGMASGAVKG